LQAQLWTKGISFPTARVFAYLFFPLAKFSLHFFDSIGMMVAQIVAYLRVGLDVIQPGVCGIADEPQYLSTATGQV
jgi:hypothetical protein